METTEQIQNPVLPESPVPDIQAQPPESQTQDSERPAEDEVALTAEIAQLWQIHNDFKSSLRQQSQNLHSLRAELGKKLAAMKALLARPGCSGKWSSWLKEHKIARSTADRLVLQHERSLNPDGNCLTEAISEPTEEEIKSLFDKLTPKLRRVLRTPLSVYRFIDLLSSSFEGLSRRITEEGFMVLRPSQQTAMEPEPAEPPVESLLPVPMAVVEPYSDPIQA